MQKPHWYNSWLRLLLWSHVISVVSFYLILWWRTRPDSHETGDKGKTTTRPALQGTMPSVSIIVPARNEEQNIRRCVTSLLEQNYDDYEVIVVDDGSTDGTARILDEIAHYHSQRQRLYVLRLRDLPKGWAGKPHALHAGVQEARGDWLMFTDADTWHAPGALCFVMS